MSKLNVVNEFHVNHISVQYFLPQFEQDLPTFLEAANEKQKCITHVTKIHKLFFEYCSVRWISNGCRVMLDP
jgi:hypothetical protein